ncbi:TATA-box-binding protein 1 [Entamoeba marina]
MNKKVRESVTKDNKVIETKKEESVSEPLKIYNASSSINLNCKLNLRALSQRIQNVEYNPKRINCLIIRIVTPKSTIKVFENGTIISIGASSVKKSALAVKKMAKKIRKCGYEINLTKQRISSLGGIGSVPFKVRLRDFAESNYSVCEFDPEITCGAIYKMENPKVTIRVFENGKVMIQGAKTEDALTHAYEVICKELILFKKNLEIID